MSPEEIHNKEVRPATDGWYRVTLFQYNRENESDPTHFDDWLDFDGGAWDYTGYEGRAFVCCIHKKEVTRGC